MDQNRDILVCTTEDSTRWVTQNAILAPVVPRVDSAIHWINHYALDNSIGFASVYLLDSDLSGG